MSENRWWRHAQGLMAKPLLCYFFCFLGGRCALKHICTTPAPQRVRTTHTTHMRAHTRTHTRARARAHTHTHTYKHTHAYTYTHTSARTCTPTNMHTRARAHTHTHARAIEPMRLHLTDPTPMPMPLSFHAGNHDVDILNQSIVLANEHNGPTDTAGAVKL